MVYIPKRKIVLFIIFTVMFGVSTHILREQNTDVFSNIPAKIIILDSGHGLPDGGAIGINGTIESTLNLKIAKKAKKMLQAKGYTVIMTRETEDSITDEGNTISARKKSDMNKRLHIINNSGADMFVSIHMNKFSDSRYRGAQVIYSGNFEESALLAEFVQKKLHTLPDNKSKRTQLKAPRGIFLLKNAQIPAILIECGFLSNFEEEKLLNTDKYQTEMAKAITEGITGYYERVEKGNENIRNR